MNLEHILEEDSFEREDLGMIVVRMTREQYSEFIQDEIHEIKKHKWIESEKAHCDLGNEAIFDWVDNCSKDFEDNWMKKHFKITEDYLISTG